MPPKRAVSAYFLFCNEHRGTAKAEYLAASGTEKVNVAAIAKLLGEKWRQLTDEERKTYQAKAAELSAAAAAESAARETEGASENGGLDEQVLFPDLLGDGDKLDSRFPLPQGKANLAASICQIENLRKQSPSS